MAVEYRSLNDICENLKYQIEDVLGLESVVAAITAVELLNPAWLIPTVTQDERNNMLRKLTGCTVACLPDVNCYPRGLVDTILFDADGEPIT